MARGPSTQLTVQLLEHGQAFALPVGMTQFSLSTLLLTVLISLSGYAIDNCEALFASDFSFTLTRMSPVRITLFSRTQRTSVQYENGVEIVVLHLPDKPAVRDIEHQKHRVLKYDGEVVNPGDSKSRENDPSVNCHAYACLVSNVPGLPEGWIQPIANAETNNVNPLRTLLGTFFTQIKEVTVEPESLNLIAKDFSIREGDLITFLDNNMNVHSGIAIMKKTDEGTSIWVRSKLGQTITADLPINRLPWWYKFTSIQIWRRNL